MKRQSVLSIVAVLFALLQAPLQLVEAQPIEIVVDPTITFQTIDGWGGHLYPQTLPYFSNDPTFEDHLLKELRTTHIRLRSVWYLLEAENDNDDPLDIDFERIAASDTGLVHDELLLQQRLMSAGVRLLFSSWRFPYWMAGQPPDWMPGPDEKPALPDGMDDEYVESLAAYMIYARDKYGISFDAVSVANEPDIAIYIDGLTPRRLLDITLALQQRLRDAEYETVFYMPEAAAADSIGQHYTEAFYQLHGSETISSAVAYHSYRREPEVIEYFGELGRRLSLPVWVTEQSHTHLGVEDRFEWSHALKNAVCLHDVLVDGNASISLYWSYAMSSSRGLGLYIPETQSWAPAYDMLKHFYNFVPTGSKRIDVSPDRSDELLASGYAKSPEGGITVVLVHTGSTPRQVTMSARKGHVQVTGVYVSTSESTLQWLEPANVFTVPPGSVVTVEMNVQH